LKPWLPAVLELALLGLKTRAAGTASEIVEFLTASPAPEQILNYHASEQSQHRLQQLLALNEAGLLGEQEQDELDELQKIEHVMILLKAQAAGEMR
jgi:hypothetical protein